MLCDLIESTDLLIQPFVDCILRGRRRSSLFTRSRTSLSRSCTSSPWISTSPTPSLLCTPHRLLWLRSPSRWRRPPASRPSLWCSRFNAKCPSVPTTCGNHHAYVVRPLCDAHLPVFALFSDRQDLIYIFCSTVLVPKQVMEDYVVQETRMVAIQIPVTYQRSKWISIPREISIPRPMVEKRVITKTVPKVIQVEEQYEIEVGMTEMQSFMIGADTDGSGDLLHDCHRRCAHCGTSSVMLPSLSYVYITCARANVFGKARAANQRSFKTIRVLADEEDLHSARPVSISSLRRQPMESTRPAGASSFQLQELHRSCYSTCSTQFVIAEAYCGASLESHLHFPALVALPSLCTSSRANE